MCIATVLTYFKHNRYIKFLDQSFKMLNFPEYLVILGGNEVVTRGATGDEFYQLLPEKEDTT